MGSAMSGDRRMRLWSMVAERAHGSPASVDHVGAVTAAVAGVDAVAVTVALSASPRETVYASNRAAADLEELTTTLGEGPGVDALSNGPAFAADLTDAYYHTRWPAFTPAAINSGVRAAFALPMWVGGIRLGVMDLYRATPGGLDHDQRTDVLLLADTACALLLDTTPPGMGHRPESAGLHHPEVHQATGMIIAQLGVTAAVALIRLRAYAYTHERRLRDVAADVVARRLRFHHDPDEPPPTT